MLSRTLRRKVENRNLDETIKVAIDLGPESVSAGDEEVNEILSDYGIESYDSINRPEWWKVRIHCQPTVRSLQDIDENIEEERIEHVFIPNSA